MPVEVNVKYNKSRHFTIGYEFLEHPAGPDGLRRAIERVRNQTASTTDKPKYNGKDWVCMADSHILKVNSPRLSGPMELTQACDVLQSIQAAGYKISRRCGQHVYIEVPDFTTDQLRITVCYWLKLDPVVRNATPAHQSGPISYVESSDRIERMLSNKAPDLNDVVSKVRHNRHEVLNVSGFDQYRIAEFWFGNMTYNVEVVKNRVRFPIWFVDVAKCMPAPENLNCFTPIQILRLLGLHESPGSPIVKRFSPAVLSIRRWLLENLKRNIPSS